MTRQPRGPMTTLGEMRRKEPTCTVCGLGFTVGEPVAWTVGRDRIHESCIDRAREVMHVVDGVAGLRVLPVTCASCGRATDALCVVPVSAQDRVAS